MQDDLKPCPFCGSSDVEPSWCENVSGEVSGRFVECSACSACGPLHRVDEAKAIAAWNTRAAAVEAGVVVENPQDSSVGFKPDVSLHGDTQTPRPAGHPCPHSTPKCAYCSGDW